MATMRLKDNHPTMQKLMRLYELADEIGLSLNFDDPNRPFAVIVHDDAYPGVRFELRYIEPHWHVTSWPPTSEFRVTYEAPDAE